MIPAISNFVTLEQFYRVGLTIGQAVSVIHNPKARIPAYQLELNFGEDLSREHKALCGKDRYISSAQLCSNHKIDEISQQLLLCVYNFPRKQIGKMMSDCLVTGVQKQLATPDERRETTVFITPSCQVPLGSTMTLLGEIGYYSSNPRDLSWEDFTQFDFRIGTVVSPSRPLREPISEDIDPVIPKHMQIDLGDEGIHEAVGFLRNELAQCELVGHQVMVLTNLLSSEISEVLGDASATAVICTIAGRALLQPARQVENGFKLA